MGDDTIKRNISKNIGKFREARGMSQKELAQKLGVVPSRISNWETGANCPTIDILFEVCEVLNVSINDIYGVYPDSKFILQYDEQEIIKKYRALDSFGRETVDITLDRETSRMKQLQERDSRITELEAKPAAIIDMQTHPGTAKRLISYYYKNASAGTGQIIFDNPPSEDIEIPDIPKYRCVSYAIGVNGNSMEPVYHDGDILLVEATREIQIGQIGIFQLNGECFVKKLGKEELISLNEDYDNIPLNESTTILGRVIDTVQQ